MHRNVSGRTPSMLDVLDRCVTSYERGFLIAKRGTFPIVLLLLCLCLQGTC
jgi:hypothetical protein